MDKKDMIYNKHSIKELLISIKKPKNDFKVILSNEFRSCIRGTYGIDINGKASLKIYYGMIKNNNELISVAIHEYAHHFINGHTIEFWESYFKLLEIAEEKGFYHCNIEKSDKLKEITTFINKNNLIKNKKIFIEKYCDIFPVLWVLCDEINIDFKHYTVKYLNMNWYKKNDSVKTYKNFCENYILWKRNCLYKNGKLRNKFMNNIINNFIKDFQIKE